MKRKNNLTDQEKRQIWAHVDNEGFGYYMMHWGPDLNAIERMGFNRKKVEAAIKLFEEIESEIDTYEELFDEEE